MRHTLLKLTGLLLVLTMALTGCNLIGVDAMKKLDEDFAALNKDLATVVADYDGGSITKGDVLGNFASYYNYYAQMYSSFGLTLDDNTVESVKQQVLESAVQAVAVDKQIASRDLSLSDEKLEEIKQAAADNYQQAYDSFYANTTGKDAELRARQTEYDLLANGYSEDSFYKSELQQANYELVEENVRNEIPELTDEELQTAYDEKVAEDETSYEGNPGSFESAMSSEDDIVTWMPEGYRTVKHILVKPADDVLQAVTDARSALTTAQTSLEGFQSELDALNDDDAAEDAETTEDAEAEAAEDEAAEDEAADTEDAEPEEPARDAAAIQADIDQATADVEAAQASVDAAVQACLDSVKEKTDEIYGKLAEGADFADLIAEYGEDPGMQNEPTATRGYYVCADSTTWDQNFTDGAMALENVGDYSTTPVVSSSGVHIIRYESDVTPGAVPLEEIHDALYDETLENDRSEHFSDELESWIEALNPVYHLDAFNIG